MDARHLVLACALPIFLILVSLTAVWVPFLIRYFLIPAVLAAPLLARLFRNPKDVAKDYYRRTGIFPIMHTMVIREDVHAEHPWVAKSLYQAFCAARDLAIEGLYDTDALHLSLPFLIDHVEETWRVLGKDFWSYGPHHQPAGACRHRPIRIRAAPVAAAGDAGGAVPPGDP